MDNPRGVSSHHVLQRAFGDAYFRREKGRHATLLFCALERRVLVKARCGRKKEIMAMGTDVDNAVIKLCSQYKRPVSIDDVARDLNTSTSEIIRFVSAHLQMNILEGSMDALMPGPAMGL